MKKTMSLFLIVCVLFCLVACDKSQPASNQGSNNAGQQSAQQATQKPTTPPHTHDYTSEVTKEANCGKTGVRTYTCSCGDKYTETIATVGYHDWEYATCTKPDTCKVCGTTRGNALGHNGSIGKCGSCEVDLGPKVKILTKLPTTLNYYRYDGAILTSLEITEASVSSSFGCLYFNWNGRKTYENAEDYVSSVRYSIIVKDSEGYVVETIDDYRDKLKVGDKVKGQIMFGSNYDASKSYTIEIVEYD